MKANLHQDLISAIMQALEVVLDSIDADATTNDLPREAFIRALAVFRAEQEGMRTDVMRTVDLEHDHLPVIYSACYGMEVVLRESEREQIGAMTTEAMQAAQLLALTMRDVLPATKARLN